MAAYDHDPVQAEPTCAQPSRFTHHPDSHTTPIHTQRTLTLSHPSNQPTRPQRSG